MPPSRACGDTILDPYMGSGTTAHRGWKAGRMRFVATWRSDIHRQTGDGPLFEEPEPEPLRLAI